MSSNKTCYCHNCDRYFDPLGIMNHRKAHLVRGETVTITYTHGNTHTHEPQPRHMPKGEREASP